MEEYRTEEEQVEALRRWWDENGKSTVAAIVVALAAGLGWQAFGQYQERQTEQASDMYQSLTRMIGDKRGPEVPEQGVELAEQIKRNFDSSTYAQFAALHLAAINVERGELEAAEAELRWVLGRADTGSDTHRITQLRLARVLAARGEVDQALAIIDGAGSGAFGASYAAAKGDILLATGEIDGAREAYAQALALASASRSAQTGILEQKLKSLTPVTPTVLAEIDAPDAEDPAEPAAEGES
ncbi:MAG: tetratricopeptide repeat protein [Halioglobus sp.]|nr:tetratricopeptide repeat protein [Halioglobus sp.]